MAVTFDLFGTLVDADTPDDPAAAVARELRDRDVRVPDDFGAAYREVHVDAPDGAEVPLPAHVSAALGSRGVDAPNNAARRAVVAAFDPDVERRAGALAAVEAARDRGPVGVCSNCSVPELARRALIRADLRDEFDVVVTSVGCGWRKPDARAFETAARRLDVDVAELVHVGDDPKTDGGEASRASRTSPGARASGGGIEEAGGRFVHVAETPLADLPAMLEVMA